MIFLILLESHGIFLLSHAEGLFINYYALFIDQFGESAFWKLLKDHSRQYLNSHMM